MGVGRCWSIEAGIKGLMKRSMSRCHVVGRERDQGRAMTGLGGEDGRE